MSNTPCRDCKGTGFANAGTKEQTWCSCEAGQTVIIEGDPWYVPAPVDEGEYALTDERRAEIISNAGCLPAHDAKAMLELMNEMGYTIYRKRVVNQQVKRRTSRKITPELAAEIREYVRTRSWLNQKEVGDHFGISAGRVSEALNGRR